jgi:hypothetical protein
VHEPHLGAIAFFADFRLICSATHQKGNRLVMRTHARRSGYDRDTWDLESCAQQIVIAQSANTIVVARYQRMSFGCVHAMDRAKFVPDLYSMQLCLHYFLCQT